MFLLFRTVNVASEYIPPSERGCGTLVPVAAVLAVVPGNLSAPVPNKFLNCVWSCGNPRPVIQSCISL